MECSCTKFAGTLLKRLRKQIVDYFKTVVRYFCPPWKLDLAGRLRLEFWNTATLAENTSVINFILVLLPQLYVLQPVKAT